MTTVQSTLIIEIVCQRIASRIKGLSSIIYFKLYTPVCGNATLKLFKPFVLIDINPQSHLQWVTIRKLIIKVKKLGSLQAVTLQL